jgi:hypothetical protein
MTVQPRMTLLIVVATGSVAAGAIAEPGRIALEVQPAAWSQDQAAWRDEGRPPADGQCTVDRRARGAAGLPGQPLVCQLSAVTGKEPSGDAPILRGLAALSKQIQERPEGDDTMCGALLCLGAPTRHESVSECGLDLRQFRSQVRLLGRPQLKASAYGGHELDSGNRGSATGARLPLPRPFKCTRSAV